MVYQCSLCVYVCVVFVCWLCASIHLFMSAQYSDKAIYTPACSCNKVSTIWNGCMPSIVSSSCYAVSIMVLHWSTLCYYIYNSAMYSHSITTLQGCFFERDWHPTTYMYTLWNKVVASLSVCSFARYHFHLLINNSVCTHETGVKLFYSSCEVIPFTLCFILQTHNTWKELLFLFNLIHLMAKQEQKCIDKQ